MSTVPVLPKCTRLGEITPLPVKTDGSMDFSCATTNLSSMQLYLPPLPKGPKYRPDILGAVDDMLNQLKPGRILLIENVSPFEAHVHPALRKYALEVELLRSWWGLYRYHGAIVAALTAEVYVPSEEKAYKYVVYETNLTKKRAPAFISYFVNQNVCSVIVGISA